MPKNHIHLKINFNNLFIPNISILFRFFWNQLKINPRIIAIISDAKIYPYDKNIFIIKIHIGTNLLLISKGIKNI